MQSHENLSVWKKSIDLAIRIYHLTDKFPVQERYGLTSQMRRAAVSIPSNIAEGRRRGTDADFLNFLRIAHGSLAELDTQLLISSKLMFCTEDEFRACSAHTTEVGKMLHGMMRSIR
ncbi:MAG: four helix bundle protein [bacterium]|nr:four helix bundle protein [bacterium]